MKQRGPRICQEIILSVQMIVSHVYHLFHFLSIFWLATSSGGYGASPEQTWSDKAQRGVDLPTGTLSLSLSDNSAGLIDKATDGTDLKNELQDAKQGTDGGIFSQEDEWGIEKGAGKDF